MAQKLIKVGSRQVDVTGLSEAQVKKVVGASKNGGSLASRALATQLQKQQGGANPNIGTTIKGKLPSGVKLPTDSTIKNPSNQQQIQATQAGGNNGLTFDQQQAYDAFYKQGQNTPSWNPNVITSANVQMPGTVGKLINGLTQFTGVRDTLPQTATGVDKKTGAIDPTKSSQSLYDLEKSDTRLNFNMNNPALQVDAFGNRQDIVLDPRTGETRLVQTAGGPLSGTLNAFGNAIGNYTSNFKDAVSNAQNANYNFLTRNMASDKAQEMEAKKQELAQRGIPIDYSNDPNKPTLWQKTMGDIDRKYQDLTNQANNQAIMAGNETLGAQVGAQNNILGSLTNTAQAFKQNATPYQGANIDLSGTVADATKTASGADLTKYQTDKDYAAKMAQIKAQKAAAGGVGGSSGGGSQVVFNG